MTYAFISTPYTCHFLSHLDYACCHSASVEVIKVLIGANPSAPAWPDNNGWLPIHVSCRIGASEEVLRLLLSVYPSSLWSKTKKGSTPLICAQKNGDKSGHIVNFLENATKSDQNHLKKDKEMNQHDMIGVVEPMVTSRALGA